MITSILLDTAIGMFDWQDDVVCETCGKVKREGWYSFKTEAVLKSSSLYETLSDIIHKSEMDEDSAYIFTVRSLEALEQLGLETYSVEELEDHLESLESFVEPPVYTSDLTGWVAKSNLNAARVTEAMESYGRGAFKTLDELIQATYRDAYSEILRKVMEELASL